jgi:hypothetical protein
MRKYRLFYFVGGHTQGIFLKMKKQYFKVFCVLSVLVSGFIGCDTGNGTTSGGNNDPKSVKIENITLTGLVGIWVFAELPVGNNSPQNVAIQSDSISENTISVDLVVPRDNTWNTNTDGTPCPKWTGNGNYYVAIIPISGGSYQGNDARIFVNDGNTAVKVTFNNAIITLDFGKFKLFSELSQ